MGFCCWARQLAPRLRLLSRGTVDLALRERGVRLQEREGGRSLGPQKVRPHRGPEEVKWEEERV